MLYPRGICLFPPLPPIPSFLAYTKALHLKSRADGSGWGRRGEVPLLASLVYFLPFFSTRKPGLRLAQNANAQRLVWIAHKN